MKPLSPDQEDHSWMHALNQTHAMELSSTIPSGFAALISTARLVRVVQPQAAFMIACDQDAPYDSPNFLWFRRRYDRFLYVDRVAVSTDHRRKGLARVLYDDLFALARAEGFVRVVAEVNSDPPNPASDAFHVALGFQPVGTAYLADRDKSVTYYCAGFRT